MKNYWHRLGLMLAVLLCVGVTAQADVVWTQDFSNVSNWAVINDPGVGSTITSDGSQGLFYVDAANNLAAFGLAHAGTSGLVLFNAADKNDYTLSFTVNSVTWSTSYEFALDEFDASGNYVGTVWNVYPASSTTTFTGSDSVGLGGFTYDAGTAYLAPKLTVHTGDGGQTVAFGAMGITVVPEPTTGLLVVAGFVSLLGLRCAQTRTPRS
jgi:hypothetical protein